MNKKHIKKELEKFWKKVKNNPAEYVQRTSFIIIGYVLILWAVKMVNSFLKLFENIPSLMKDLEPPHDFYATLILLYIIVTIIGLAINYGLKILSKGLENKK